MNAVKSPARLLSAAVSLAMLQLGVSQALAQTQTTATPLGSPFHSPPLSFLPGS